MRPGRELDTRIATEVFGHKVWARGKVLYENPETGERPLRNYTREVEWAWKVAEKMKISILPIENNQWFAFVGPESVDGWPAPEAMLKVLEEKKFDGCGAAVGDNIAFVICEAAIRAIDKRKQGSTAAVIQEEQPAPQDVH